MRDSPLLFGLAAVFAGLTTVLAVVAIVTREFFVLGVALPFAATTYFMWFQASGKLHEKVAGGTYADAPGERRRTAEQKAREGARGGRSRFAREARRAAEERRRRDRFRQAGRVSDSGRRRQRRQRRGTRMDDGPTRKEALSTLGLRGDADEEKIREAYREKVKEVHPDTPDGDEDAFKRVNAAYERLKDDW
ncbi:J domain-containing protein [Haloarchaeobius sp. HME9146]|uniref:J domain-containing protein n=1 Tax=Haloarchaeobius sp. HME9146 TaxID=2978732 RepID=UPI0021C0481F|nr:J domain-containing protein [Haloarchaeobius sp. HME9146]